MLIPGTHREKTDGDGPSGEGENIMKRLLFVLALPFAAVFPLLLVAPEDAAAHVGFLEPGVDACAFEDVDDNGMFTSMTDIPVLDSAWLGGNPFVSNHPFVVPVGCNHTLVTLPPPLRGVKVTETKITFLGELVLEPPGGKGVLLIADPARVPAPALGNGAIRVGDGVNRAKIEAGGFNDEPLTTFAVPRKAVALLAAGECMLNNAELKGNRPTQDTRVGINCNNDITIRQTTIIGSKINIQSINGMIDAKSGGDPPGPQGIACDDPVKNLVNGAAPPGDGDGIFPEPEDFPCQILFRNTGDITNFCQPPVVDGRNSFQARNDPLIMIAKRDLDVSGLPGNETELLGRFKVKLIAEDGNVNTSNALITNGPPIIATPAPPGGAKIFVFADPTSVNRLPVDMEKATGPCNGTIDLNSACYRSPNPIQVCGSLIGTPDPPPCAQNPPDFTQVTKDP